MGRSQQERIELAFSKLRKRLKRMEQRYNPADENLHFACLSIGDADLYPELVSLASDGLREVKRHHTYFARHALYDDGMFWYDLFLAISAAANRVRVDMAQTYIPETLVEELMTLLVQITRYAAEHSGDIAKRNYEALANTLLTFYSKERVRLLRREVKMLPESGKNLVRSAVRKVEDIRAAK
jgi:hypothetical protein